MKTLVKAVASTACVFLAIMIIMIIVVGYVGYVNQQAQLSDERAQLAASERETQRMHESNDKWERDHPSK